MASRNDQVEIRDVSAAPMISWRERYAPSSSVGNPRFLGSLITFWRKAGR